MKKKGMSLRRAIKRRNILIVDDLTVPLNPTLTTIVVTHKNKASQRYRYSNQAVKPYKIAYTAEQLDIATTREYEHTFKDGETCKYLASTLLGPLAPIKRPNEVSLSN